VTQINGIDAPANQNYDHHRRNLHDAHGLLAGFVNSLDVVPPEIESAQNREARGAEVRRNVQTDVNVVAGLVEQSNDILPGRHAADRAGQNVVEHQGGNAEFGQRTAHRFFDHPVHAAAHEHAAAFDVNRAYRIGKQHDPQDEPGRRLADVAFRLAARIISGGSQVIQDDGCGTPEGNEAQ